jgi:DNA-binding MarR family transcriptional regulator
MQPAEYLVVVQLLNRGPRGRTRESIYRALDYTRPDVDEAITTLEREGVLTSTGRLVRASAALACLDRLDLIAV